MRKNVFFICLNSKERPNEIGKTFLATNRFILFSESVLFGHFICIYPKHLHKINPTLSINDIYRSDSFSLFCISHIVRTLC